MGDPARLVLQLWVGMEGWTSLARLPSPLPPQAWAGERGDI